MRYTLLIFCALNFVSHSKEDDKSVNSTIVSAKQNVANKISGATNKLKDAKKEVETKVEDARCKISNAFIRVKKEVEAAVEKIVKRITGN